MQPIAAKVATALNQNAVSAYHNNYQMVAGRLKYFQREKLKVEKQIYRLRWVPVEEPGVIPKILEEVRQTLGHFRTESQPRVDAILDSVNGAVVETTGVLQNVKELSGSIQAFFEFVKRNSGLLKLGAFILGGVTVFLILMAGIVLFRIAFGL